MPASESRRLLRERLPGASDKVLDRLLEMIEQRSPPSEGPLETLLQEGFSPTLIQAAVIDCRDSSLGKAASDRQAAARALRQADRLTLLLLQATGRDWRARVHDLESRLSVAGNELQLSGAKGRWLREGGVTLYNYFREMPVMARCVFRDVPDADVAVEFNHELVPVVAAGQHGRFVHARLPDVHSCLRLEVAERAGKLVYFSYAGIFRTARERRQHIRVQCDDVPDVILTRSSGHAIEAGVRDISEHGLGLRSEPGASLRSGDRFAFQLALASGPLTGDCTVRWTGPADQGRFGVELEMTLPALRRLRLELGHRQKRVSAELRIMGMPDSLI